MNIPAHKKDLVIEFGFSLLVDKTPDESRGMGRDFAGAMRLNPIRVMDPAFSSTRQIAAFACLLLLTLLLPLLVGKSLLVSREQMYVPLPFHDQIFEEKGDIDIAFMGSSRMGCAVDTSYIQQKLSEKLGHQAVVRSLTWTWNGFDALYFIAQDLMEHRHVRMLVFSDLYLIDGHDLAHHQASLWFRLADNAEALAGLPLKSKVSFYASAIIGMPQNLLEKLRTNLPEVPSTSAPWYYTQAAFTPHSTSSPSDTQIYSEASRASFQFSDTSIAPMQRDFISKITSLAQAHQTKLVFLHLPDFSERQDTILKEEAFWPDVFGTNLPMIGIPPASLFAGMTDQDVLALYHNPTHFNQIGQLYFSQMITPRLIEVYEEQVKP